jgi:hypothetical protein
MPSMRADRCGAFDVELRAADACQGWSCVRSDAVALGAVPALRVSMYPHLSSATGTGAELVQGSSLVATGWAAGAQEAGAQTHCHRKASSELAVDDEHGPGLRLRVRHHGRRAAHQMFDGGGRVHPGMFGHRCGRRYSVPARHRGIGVIDQHSWRAVVPSLRQRPGVRQPCDLGVDCQCGHRHIAERSGQAMAKRYQRELQWQVPR